MNASHLPTAPAPATARVSDRHSDVAARLQQSQIFRDYQQAFQTATGLPLVLRAAGSFQPPLKGAKNVNGFCALMAATSKTCALCLQMQQRFESEAAGASATLQCFAGMTESVVPVRLGETIIGYLQTGQVMLRPPSEKSFRAAMALLERWTAGLDAAELHAAYFQTRVVTKGHYEAVVRLLSSFAQHLSLLSNEIMIKQTAVEPPAVVKARAFISANLAEPLCLEQVAHAASMSAFYFCKVFKSATGLTFTDYVARARVEQTKQILLNPNTRVSEAAYAAGFQSLSQFNRVFRRIVGEAPSDYRERLHGRAPVTTSRGLAYAA